MPRHDGRRGRSLRPVGIRKGYITSEANSILFETGATRVICAATLEERVPPFLRNTGKGWITAEYGMLPRSSPQRIPRESVRGSVKGRTHEIQRLIGRSIRAGVDLEAIGERTLIVDCDVLEADGGTRTASINGGFMAAAGALRSAGLKDAVKGFVAAVSVGMKGGRVLLDPDYLEDSTADVDMNFVIDENGMIIEVQGTAEGAPFSGKDLERMLAAARAGVTELIALQKKGLRWR